jgi:hypothetical protein
MIPIINLRIPKSPIKVKSKHPPHPPQFLMLLNFSLIHSQKVFFFPPTGAGSGGDGDGSDDGGDAPTNTPVRVERAGLAASS